MTERCSVDGPRRPERSYEELSCELSAEQVETKKQEASAMRQADADARRDAWIGGASRDAASAIAKQSPSCEGPTEADRAREAAAQRSREMHLASMRHSAKYDRPLEDDIVGNCIPGLVAGGIVAGGSAAGTALEKVASKAAIAVAHHVAEDVAGDVIHHAVEHGVHALSKRIGDASAAPHAVVPDNGSDDGSAASAPSVAAPAGRSGGRAVSEAAPDPLDGGQSFPSPPPAGRDAIPFLPGQAPARIPEITAGPPGVMIRG